MMTLEAMKGRFRGLCEEINTLYRGAAIPARTEALWAEARELRDRIAHVEMLNEAFEEGRREILRRAARNYAIVMARG